MVNGLEDTKFWSRTISVRNRPMAIICRNDSVQVLDKSIFSQSHFSIARQNNVPLKHRYQTILNVIPDTISMKQGFYSRRFGMNCKRYVKANTSSRTNLVIKNIFHRINSSNACGKSMRFYRSRRVIIIYTFFYRRNYSPCETFISLTKT